MNPRYYYLCGISSFIVTFIFVMFNRPYTGNVVYTLPIPNQHGVEYGQIDRVQLDCMARNIFFESRGEAASGKAMVGFVVLERTQSPHFPSTVCGVVHQAERDAKGHIILYRCAFSWYCDGEDHHINFHDEVVAKEWDESYIIAKLVMLGKIKPRIDMYGVTHYHARTKTPSGKPFWALNKNYKLVAHIGGHFFYRWKKAMLPKWEPVVNANNIAMN